MPTLTVPQALTLATQHFTAGSLAVASKIVAGKANLGLTPKMYAHLVYKTANGTADITPSTVT